MLKAIIIDDEKTSRTAVRNLLVKYCSDDIIIVNEADGVKDAVLKIGKHKPDVIFLDIQMQDGTGFDLLEALPNIDFSIVFITAYEQYAIKAFKYSAFNYLTKPVDPDDIIDTVNKLKKGSKYQEIKEKLDVLLKNRNGYEKIALPTQHGLRFVKIKDIVRCRSESNYTRFFLIHNEEFLVTRTLREYENLLPPEKFIRIHQSHLINLAYVEKYNKGEGGSVIMEDGSEVEVSRRKKESLLNILMKK